MFLIMGASISPSLGKMYLIWGLRTGGFSKDGTGEGEEHYQRYLWGWEAKESKDKIRHMDLRAGMYLRFLRGCDGKPSDT